MLSVDNEVARSRQWIARNTDSTDTDTDTGNKILEASKAKGNAIMELDLKKAEVEQTARVLMLLKADTHRMDHELKQQTHKCSEVAAELALCEEKHGVSTAETAAASIAAPTGASTPERDETLSAAAEAMLIKLRRKLAEGHPPARQDILRALTDQEKAALLRIVDPPPPGVGNTTTEERLWAAMFCTGCKHAVRTYASDAGGVRGVGGVGGGGVLPINPPSTASSIPSVPSHMSQQSSIPQQSRNLPGTHLFGQVASVNKYWHSPVHTAPVRAAHPSHPYSTR